MLRMVRGLPTPVEFVTVITVAFGGFIYYSVQTFFTSPRAAVVDSAGPSYWTDAALQSLVAQEIAVLAVLAAFLRIRGWRFGDFDWQVTWKLCSIAVLLVVGHYAIYYSAYRIVTTVGYAFTGSYLGLDVGPVAATDASGAALLSLSTVILISVVNPIFEEVLVVGYVMTVIQRRFSMWLAINVSTLIRVSYHLYQGPIALISIIPMGLLFGYYYARTGKLWPLILAHALMDFIALYALMA